MKPRAWKFVDFPSNATCYPKKHTDWPQLSRTVHVLNRFYWTDWLKASCIVSSRSTLHYITLHTPNANMADHSVGARDESHGSEVSQALVFCFDNAFPEKSCFVVDLAFLFRPLYPFLCCRMPPQESEIFHSRESVLFFSYLVRLLGETKETEARS